VTVGYRKPHNEELHNLFSAKNIINMNKSKRMRLVGHAAYMEQI
jgi:hypothetical protein